MDPKLKFSAHINLAINKAKCLLSFIKRWAKEFNDPYTTKALYVSLVRPILEYASVLWCPYYNSYIDSLESVQKQFLLFALRSLRRGSNFILPPYENRLKLINLPTLRQRGTVANILFVFKLIDCCVDASFLLSFLSINVPARNTRTYLPIKLKTSYLDLEPMRLTSIDFNEHYHLIHLSETVTNLKRKLYSYFTNPLSN